MVYFSVDFMLRVGCVSVEQQVGDGKVSQQVKIYGPMLKSPQVNALILIFHMARRAVTVIY